MLAQDVSPGQGEKIDASSVGTTLSTAATSVEERPFKGRVSGEVKYRGL